MVIEGEKVINAVQEYIVPVRPYIFPYLLIY
jgi:hypothetical protein